MQQLEKLYKIVLSLHEDNSMSIIDVCINPSKGDIFFKLLQDKFRHLQYVRIYFDTEFDKCKKLIEDVCIQFYQITLKQKTKVLFCGHHWKKDSYKHYFYEPTTRYRLKTFSKYYQEYKREMQCKKCGDIQIGKYMGTTATGWAVSGRGYSDEFKKFFAKILKEFNLESLEGMGSWWHLEFSRTAAEYFDNGGENSCRAYMRVHLGNIG